MRGAFATFGRVILLSYFDLFEVIFVRHIFLHGRPPVYFLYYVQKFCVLAKLFEC